MVVGSFGVAIKNLQIISVETKFFGSNLVLSGTFLN
jgi:hypothetical protein